MEAATNVVTGNVDAAALGRLAEKRPLSRELADIADAARALPDVTRSPLGGSGVGDIGAAGALALIAHKPKSAGVLLGRPIAASLGASRLMQPAVTPRANARPIPLAGAPAVLSPQPNDMETTWEKDSEGNLVGFTKKPSAAAKPMPVVEEETQ